MGASKGIGAQIAKQLAQKNARLFLLARNIDDLRKVSDECMQEYGQKVNYFSADVTKREQIKKAVNAMLQEMGEIDGVIYNAGFARPGTFADTSLSVFSSHMQIDYMGAIAVIKETLPFIKNEGFISLTSSVLGFMGLFGYTPYSGPKFALIGFAESLRQELLRNKISVSVLCPPDTDTPGFAMENETKPMETKILSEGAGLMNPSQVAKQFLKKLQKRKFLILCNLQSYFYYKFHSFFPSLFRYIVDNEIRKAQKKSLN